MMLLTQSYHDSGITDLLPLGMVFDVEICDAGRLLEELRLLALTHYPAATHVFNVWISHIEEGEWEISGDVYAPLPSPVSAGRNDRAVVVPESEGR